MSLQPQHITFELPEWITAYMASIDTLITLEARMRFVTEASRLNVVHTTGGPFAAAIFERESGRLISLGVNLVTTQNCSALHAEMVAIMMAQKVLGTYDLGGADMSDYQLITSAEPCAMCLGAIPWSGLKEVISGASDADVRAIGFDEGPKIADWQHALQTRGIAVKSRFMQQTAVDVLKFYAHNGGHIYNSRES